MPLSKDYISQELARLQSGVNLAAGVPKHTELAYPMLHLFYPSIPEVPNPFTPENGKSYLWSYLAANHVIKLPDPLTIEPGFTFDIWAISLQPFGPFRLEIHLHDPLTEMVLFAESLIGALSNRVPVAVDAVGETIEGIRFTYQGIMSLPAWLGELTAIPWWSAQRVDGQVGGMVKTVHRATTGALPACTTEGEGPNKTLTATGAGLLTVDGKTYSDLADYTDLIFVKDQTSSDCGIYRLVQLDPWRLRRASIDQSYYQVNRRGALFQVMFGTANEGKQFYRESYSSAIYEAGGGSVGGVFEDVYVLSSGTPINAEAWKFYSCHGSTSQVFNVPSASFSLLGAEIGFKVVGAGFLLNGAYVQLSGVWIDDVYDRRLNNPNEVIIIRCVISPYSFMCSWVIVNRSGNVIAPDIVYENTNLSTSGGLRTIVQWVPKASNKATHIRATVWARQSGGSAGSPGDSAKWVIEALGHYTGPMGISVKYQQAISVYKDTGATLWNVNVTHDSVNHFQVTTLGEDNKNIEWRCQLEASEHG